MFNKARDLEALMKHGFISVSFSAINCLAGVPGMFTLFRTELVKNEGGFSCDMNGEDTSMTLRLGELGYDVLVDPNIEYLSEVPQSYVHMREQRMRWFRSAFHLTAESRDILEGDLLSFRGKVILPWMLINSARRAFMVPVLLCLAMYAIMLGVEELYFDTASIMTMLVGMPVILCIFAIGVNMRFSELLYLPHFILFRMLRAHFTLEAILGIPIIGKSNSRLKKS